MDKTRLMQTLIFFIRLYINKNNKLDNDFYYFLFTTKIYFVKKRSISQVCRFS